MARSSQAAAQIVDLFEAVNAKGGLSRSLRSTTRKVKLDAAVAAAIKSAHQELLKEFPDLQYTLDKVVEEADRIGFRYTACGTHERINRRATWCGSGLARVRNGRVTAIHLQEDYWGRELDLGNVPDSPSDDITGEWKGEVFGVDFTMELEQSPPKDAVTGTLNVLGQSVPLTGANDPPTVKLQGKTGDGKAIAFVGTWDGNDSISGTINGGGFKKVAVEMSRS